MFKVIGVRREIILESAHRISSQTLGQFTNTELSSARVQNLILEYKGSSAGVSSINGLGSALEVLSDTEMNAYGWCYTVDGVESGLLADQYKLTGQESNITWFYAYAHMTKNKWVSMCTPADHFPQQ